MEISIPPEYLEFIALHGAVESFTEGEPGYVALWLPQDVAGNNKDIQIAELAPGYLAFAGDGGGEILAFNSKGEVFMLPLIGMEARYAQKIANNWSEFSESIELPS
ncbi:SMI1/KNR4 family protein [Pseudomonas sp. PDM16]|uniref:SMI1/KNR4 family protein n=1 Tax=Pseudomonas sp. PDM16 TaxID=2769292 RepID=UPI001781751E|nr:SMI1/KNR4 family protein [Pseudomonas sp. PDM16]MBD9415234.1 SMI1/KNR4 family protein [Pseudomonas sp. PDM16]